MNESVLWIALAVAAALAIFLVFRLVRRKPSGRPSYRLQDDPQLLSKFRAAIPNVNVRERLMSSERKKSPHKSESELIADVLEAFYRDRR